MLAIRTLGGLSLSVNGDYVTDVGSRKAEALMVYLAVERKQHHRNALAALFWPESPQEQASQSLRVLLTTLRRYFEPWLNISRETCGINPDSDVYLDLFDLEARLAGGQIDQALELYQGDFLQGLQLPENNDFENWLRCEQEYIQRIMVNGLHEALSAAIEHEDYVKGYALVRRLLVIDPLDELAHHQCILLLALNNHHNASLAQYRKYCALLQQELAAEPSESIQQLYQRIVEGENPAVLKPAAPAYNLPAPQTSFIGREAEMLQVVELIRDPDCRLITLLGPGGSGKTRLANQSADKFMAAFPDGVCFVPFETCPSRDYIIPAIANALDFQIDSFVSPVDPKIQFLDYLKPKSILLLLDGFENLVDGAGLLSEILVHAPKVQILVTSRQRLGLQGEWIINLAGLPAPDLNLDAAASPADALTLFCDRARQVKPDFKLNHSDVRHVTRICQIVEGMPLGIELAAAWTSFLEPQEIADEIEKSLDFIETSSQDFTERHRSLRAVFDSTWLLLTEEQQAVLCKLAVFHGRFDRQAALQVAGAGISQLMSLWDKSLLRKTDRGTFVMHNLLQHFALERLMQDKAVYDDTCQSHCAYYIQQLTRREPDLMGLNMLQARDEVQAEFVNIRAAVEWAVQYWEAGPVRKMFISLMTFYIIKSWYEGINGFRDLAQLRKSHLTEQGIADPDKDPIYLSARTHMALLLSNMAQIEESERISAECLDPVKQAGLNEETSECLHNLGVNASFRGEYEPAMKYLEQAVILGQECDYPLWPTYLLWLGHVYFLVGEYEQGLLSLQKCHEIYSKKGTLWAMAFALSKMGLAFDGLDEHQKAVKYHARALSTFESLGSQAGKGYCLSRMSMSHYFLGEYTRAVQYGEESLVLFQEIGHRWGLSTSLCRIGFACLGLGQISRAREHFNQAAELSEEDHMLPIKLYAAAGQACILAIDGDSLGALKLFQSLQDHPKAPKPFLKQALRWLKDIDQANLAV